MMMKRFELWFCLRLALLFIITRLADYLVEFGKVYDFLIWAAAMLTLALSVGAVVSIGFHVKDMLVSAYASGKPPRKGAE